MAIRFYFPDRVVPMLPEAISNDLCSLRELEDGPALAVRMVFAPEGRKAAAFVPPHRHVLGGQALLIRRPTAAIDGAPDEIAPACRDDPQAAVGRATAS